MKDSNEVVKEFNEIVNMTASELEKWLKSDDSQSAGWPKESEDGESVGHDSGRKIVEILKANPDKEPEKYTDDQVQHMRKVVSYCKRHLAQEEKSNSEKSAEEVKKTKSYASLKNWGHDPLKARGEGGEEDGGDDKQAGDKRKKGEDAQEGSNKKQETRSAQKKQTGDNDDEDEAEGDEEEEEEEEDDKASKSKSNGAKKNGQKNGQKKSKSEDNDEEEEDEEEDEGDDSKNDGAKPKNGPKPGDTVSWNWGNGNPKGKVLDVKGEKTSVTTKRGNEVSRDGDPEDPAVVLDTGKSKAIKSNHELN